MNILIYTQFNSRSRDTESVMESFIKNGHNVYLLTQSEWGIYHTKSAEIGVKAFAHSIKKNNVLYFLKHSLYLVKFCRKNKIDIIFSHLENASLSAVIAQYFMKAKVVTCRHIVNEAQLLNSKWFIIQNKIVYTLSRCIVVVSNRSKDFMTQFEKISQAKIHVINLSYNFNFYNKPSIELTNQIRQKYSSKFLILTASRLLSAKRPKISIDVTKKLIQDGYDVKLIILGDGPQKEELNNLIQDEGLENSIYVLGFKENIIDYIAASDLLLHPSLLDSSSVIIKEAGLLKKTIITCTGVGDVDEYIINNFNGYLVSKENPIDEIVANIKNEIENPNANLGSNLQKDIFRLFSIESNYREYETLITEIIKNE